MASIKKKSSGGGGANWMDTYGDMVTLLLCFFVLLYSMSTISEENWKALVMSFNPNAIPTPTITPGGEGPDAEADNAGGQISITNPQITQEQVDQDIETLFQALQQYVTEQNLQSTVAVTKGDGKVFISFGDTVFFDGNSPTLRRESHEVLDAVSGMLNGAKDSIQEVRVQGHTAIGSWPTPNDPYTDRNLSAQRAANVVAYIQSDGGCEVDPARLISEGCGQWLPVAKNDTPEGRAKNRRVEMIVSGRDIEAEMAGVTQYYTTSYTTAGSENG